MRWLLAVACVILALDVSIVVVQVSGPLVPPTIEQDDLAEGTETSSDVDRRSSAAPDSRPRHNSSSDETGSEPPAALPPAEAQAPASNDKAHSTQELSTPAAVSVSEPLPAETGSPSPTPASSSTPTEPGHGESWSEDDGEITVQIVLPKTRFAPGETVPFTLRMCNETAEDIMWGYSDHQDHPLMFGFTRNTEDPDSAALRNGDEGHTHQGAVIYLRLPAHDCVSWSGRWEQTLGLFDLDGTSTGEPFPPGELEATLTADGGVDGRNIRHPEYYVTMFIG